MKLVTKLLSLAVAATGILGMASRSDATIIVNVSNPGSSTAQVGDIIVARVSVSTDAPGGIAGLNVRISSGTAGIGGAMDTSPFHVVVIPVSGLSGQMVESFNPALNDPNYILAKGSSTWTLTGALTSDPIPTTQNNDRPATGFTGQGVGGRGQVAFVSSGNAVQTWFYDLSFRAVNTGNVSIFTLVGATGASGTEYTSTDLGVVSATTATITPTGGFTVAITNGAPVPEPASLGVLALGGLALLARRRRA